MTIINLGGYRRFYSIPLFPLINGITRNYFSYRRNFYSVEGLTADLSNRRWKIELSPTVASCIYRPDYKDTNKFIGVLLEQQGTPDDMKHNWWREIYGGCYVCFAFLVISLECCWQRRTTLPTALPATTPPPTVPPSFKDENTTVSLPVSTTSFGHRKPCFEKESLLTACMNGGSCMVVELHDTRQIFCSCTKDWMGDRCEDRYINPEDWAVQQWESWKLIISVIVGLTLVFVVMIGVTLCLTCRWLSRKRQREALKKEHARKNTVLQSMNANDDAENCCNT